MGLTTLSDLDLPYIRIDTQDTLRLVISELRKYPDRCEYAGEVFESVVMDSLTSDGELWMEGAMKVKGWDALWDTMGTGGKDPRQAYTYVAEKGRQTMKALMDIPAHLLCLCREGVQEEGTGELRIQFAAPELPGQKLPRELPGWPDATLHGVWLNGKRRLCTVTKNKAVAGIRLPGDIKIPDEILPNIDAVIRLMLGDKEALKDLVTEVKQSAQAPPIVRR